VSLGDSYVGLSDKVNAAACYAEAKGIYENLPEGVDTANAIKATTKLVEQGVIRLTASEPSSHMPVVGGFHASAAGGAGGAGSDAAKEEGVVAQAAAV